MGDGGPKSKKTFREKCTKHNNFVRGYDTKVIKAFTLHRFCCSSRMALIEGEWMDPHSQRTRDWSNEGPNAQYARTSPAGILHSRLIQLDSIAFVIFQINMYTEATQTCAREMPMQTLLKTKINGLLRADLEGFGEQFKNGWGIKAEDPNLYSRLCMSAEKASWIIINCPCHQKKCCREWQSRGLTHVKLRMNRSRLDTANSKFTRTMGRQTVQIVGSEWQLILV